MTYVGCGMGTKVIKSKTVVFCSKNLIVKTTLEHFKIFNLMVIDHSFGLTQLRNNALMILYKQLVVIFGKKWHITLIILKEVYIENMRNFFNNDILIIIFCS